MKNNPDLTDIYAVFTKNPVLLPLIPGTKKILDKGWPDTTWEDTQKPNYQARLKNSPSIGILLGKNSQNLLFFDWDTQAALDWFLENNPEFKKSFIVTGRGVGGQVGGYCRGTLPGNAKFRVPESSPLANGARAKADDKGTVQIGELRGDREQSVLRGIHPDTKKPYCWLSPEKPIDFDFDAVKWHPDIDLPWAHAAPHKNEDVTSDSPLKEATRVVTIDFLWSYFKFPRALDSKGSPVNPTESPFRDDNSVGHPSFSVHLDTGSGKQIFKDHHANYEHHKGDSFVFFQLASALDSHKAFLPFMGIYEALKNRETPAAIQKPAKFAAERYYFETKNRRYWFQTSKGWKDLAKEDFREHLKNAHGIPTKPEPGQLGVARAIYLVQENWVNVTSDLAGYHGPQIIVHNDLRILVKHAPKLVTPYEGDYATLLEFFDGFMAGEQGEHLNCWCADVVRHVYAKQLGSFIVPILCGPASAGKSLFQAILTAATGGRSSRPYQSMTGGTPFNEHLFASEHLIIEDEYSSGDLKSRNQLGTALKNFVANAQKLNHGKNKVAFLMPILLQFMTVSLNDETENIAQLPQKHPSLDGKVSLYDAAASKMPMPTGTPEQKAAFWAQLMKELPCWIYDLLHNTPMPKKWQTGRFMVPWRAEKISVALDELQPEIKFRELVQTLYWGSNDSSGTYCVQSYGDKAKTGSATEIESDLLQKDSPVNAMADVLLRNPAAAGRYLTRLCDRFPEEFSFKRSEDKRCYTIRLPREETK